MNICKYCSQEYQKSDRNILENQFFIANFDNHPVTEGHTKVIPKRHVNKLVELTEEELVSMRDIISKVQKRIDKEYHPQGYNIGINEGEAAGQTVFHLHIHIIPRYNGDVPNPVGGVRNIIPGKGDYRKT
jgi:diadenosine tetraphosphate (Ap4A) HIT family hydrolase